MNARLHTDHKVLLPCRMFDTYDCQGEPTQSATTSIYGVGVPADAIPQCVDGSLSYVQYNQNLGVVDEYVNLGYYIGNTCVNSDGYSMIIQCLFTTPDPVTSLTFPSSLLNQFFDETNEQNFLAARLYPDISCTGDYVVGLFLIGTCFNIPGLGSLLFGRSYDVNRY